jgi:GxxExxY protein
MPIETMFPCCTLDQSKFRKISYEVTGLAFQIQNEIGRIFGEPNYEQILGHVLQERAIQQANIRLTHRGFKKDYFMDLLVEKGCPFELKVVEDISDRHRAQLIQYLMLTHLHHGTIINFGKERVEHEFLNCHIAIDQRREFRLDRSRWEEITAEANRS